MESNCLRPSRKARDLAQHPSIRRSSDQERKERGEDPPFSASTPRETIELRATSLSLSLSLSLSPPPCVRLKLTRISRRSFMRVVDPDTWAPTILTWSRGAAPKRASISKGYRVDLKSYRLLRRETCDPHSFGSARARRRVIFFENSISETTSVARRCSSTTSSRGMEGSTLDR